MMLEGLTGITKSSYTGDDLISRRDVLNMIIVAGECEPDLGYTHLHDVVEALPSKDRPTDEEDQLKFYYVESIDDYWIGMRIDNFYYADWHEGLGFVWSHSRYLPWGEHVVAERTLWKEHTYPSEPVEISFTDWIVGFVKKYFADRPKNMVHIDDVYRLIAGHSDYHGDSILSAFTCLVEGKDVKPIAPLDESADRPTGKWVEVEEYDCVCYQCDQCKSEYVLIDGTPQDNDYNYCPHCGAKMGGDTE